jgi:hypothetical protein
LSAAVSRVLFSDERPVEQDELPPARMINSPSLESCRLLLQIVLREQKILMNNNEKITIFQKGSGNGLCYRKLTLGLIETDELFYFYFENQRIVKPYKKGKDRNRGFHYIVKNNPSFLLIPPKLDGVTPKLGQSCSRSMMIIIIIFFHFYVKIKIKIIILLH